MANIVPTILSNDLNDVKQKLTQLSGLVELVQIDLMDGEFVSAKSITAEELQTIETGIPLEAHLMVQDPSQWLPYLSPDLFRRVYFHVEALPNPETFILQAKQIGFEVGLAVKMTTPITDIENIVGMVDSVLFMSVEPGQQGQSFDPAVLEKIDNFINQFPEHLVAIDGGVSRENIDSIVKVGVENLSVGSAIFGGGDIAENIKELKELIT